MKNNAMKNNIEFFAFNGNGHWPIFPKVTGDMQKDCETAFNEEVSQCTCSGNHQCGHARGVVAFDGETKVGSFPFPMIPE